MTTYFITRHPGAVDWAVKNGVVGATVLPHVGEDFFASLKEADKVIGILPVALAFRVCAAGAEFYDLSLPQLPAEMRGKELTASQMDAFGATVTRFIVTAP